LVPRDIYCRVLNRRWPRRRWSWRRLTKLMLC